MSIYLREDEIKPGALVRTMSDDNEIVPALILSFMAKGTSGKDFVRVLQVGTDNTFLMNTLYLERWV